MTYDIKKGKLHCSHCSGEMALSQAVQQNTFQTAGGGTSTEIDGEILAGAEYHCPNCGGLMITKDKDGPSGRRKSLSKMVPERAVCAERFYFGGKYSAFEGDVYSLLVISV